MHPIWCESTLWKIELIVYLNNIFSKMNVNFEKNGNVDGIITITLAESDYAEKVNKAYEECS